jgi:uncharacterized protein YuzE
MRLHYFPETDSLYIELKAAPGAETQEVAPGLNVDLDAAGDVVGFDIDCASRRLDLTSWRQSPFRQRRQEPRERLRGRPACVRLAPRHAHRRHRRV